MRRHLANFVLTIAAKKFSRSCKGNRAAPGSRSVTHVSDPFDTDLPGDEPSGSADVLGPALARYVAGQSSADERRFVDAWRRHEPANDALVRELELGWRASAEPAPADMTWDTDAAWAVVRRTVESSAPNEATSPLHVSQRGRSSGPPRRYSHRLRRVGERLAWGVASFALAAVAVVAIAHRVTSESNTVSTYATVARQQLRVALPDGSHATLAPQSRLQVAFTNATRTVVLDGEAYFDVDESHRLPFVVRTGRTTLRVLGTRFDVRHYHDDTHVTLAVVSGKVAVVTPSGRMALAAGRVGEIDDSSTVTVGDGRPDVTTAWVDGRLVFDATPASEMLAVVGRWYGLHFTLADGAIGQRKVTAEFHTNESDKTLAAIADLLDVTMVFRDSTVTLRPRATTHRAPTGTPKSVTPPDLSPSTVEGK